MISRIELKELASHSERDAYFVSLFLNVDPTQVKQEEWLLHFKNLSRNAINAMPNGDKTYVTPDIHKLEQYLTDRPDGLKRGLAIISSTAKNFWWVYNSSLPFMSDLVVNRTPFIKPIAHQIDQYQRYLIALVAGDTVRLFIAGMGEIIEVTDIYHPSGSQNTLRDGHSGDMGEERAQHRKNNIRHILYRDAIHVIEKLLVKEEIKRIILLGTDSARGNFKETLSEPLLHKFVAEGHIDKAASESDVLEKSLPLMKVVEYKFERIALNELFDKAGALEGASAIGLKSVLDALQQGNVRKLYVMTHMVADGMSCSQCKALSEIIPGNCPWCGGKMETVPFIYDQVIQKALEQGARVDLLEEAHDLVKAGGIGALLRY